MGGEKSNNVPSKVVSKVMSKVASKVISQVASKVASKVVSKVFSKVVSTRRPICLTASLLTLQRASSWMIHNMRWATNHHDEIGT